MTSIGSVMSFYTKTRNFNNTFTIFTRSLKPWTFPASILSFLLGTSLAWKHDDKFNRLNFVLTGCVILLTHAAGNFVNSFYEAQSRRYFVSPAARTRTLELNTQWALWSYVLGGAAFAYLAFISEAEFRQEFGFYATGFLASLLHGGGLKNIVLGDVLACGIFGPVSVIFAYIEQVGTTNRQLSNAWIATYSIPFTLFTEAILHRYVILSSDYLHSFIYAYNNDLLNMNNCMSCRLRVTKACCVLLIALCDAFI